MKTAEIRLRDPFVLVENGKYYLYGTRSETAFSKEAYGFDVYISDDLENWSKPWEIFHRPGGKGAQRLARAKSQIEPGVPSACAAGDGRSRCWGRKVPPPNGERIHA